MPSQAILSIRDWSYDAAIDNRSRHESHRIPPQPARGPARALEDLDLPAPQPGPRDLLVRVKAVSQGKVVLEGF